MPDAEAMPFWALGAGDGGHRGPGRLAAGTWGEGISEDPFDSSIDASWLGTIPTAEDLADGSPDFGGSDATAASYGPLEAGA
jgi:hypothetical protein